LDENADESVSLHSDGLPSGDALLSAAELELAPIPEAAPLGNNNTIQEDDNLKISEAEEDYCWRAVVHRRVGTRRLRSRGLSIPL